MCMPLTPSPSSETTNHTSSSGSSSTGPGVTIRMLTGSDAPAYRELRLQALQTNPESYLATFASENKRSVESFASEIRYSFSPPVFGYYGIFQNETLVGYAQLEKSYMDKQQHVCFLYNLYVAPAHRGKGYATGLFQFLLRQVQEKTQLERIFLSCNRKNTAAQALYKKLGFTLYGVKEKSVKWQGQYDDELEMVRAVTA